jgi:hypothetical protein
MLRRVTLVRTDASEQFIASIIRMIKNQRDSEIVTTNVPSLLILFTVMMEAIRSSETSVLTSTTLRHIPEDDILQNISHTQSYSMYFISAIVQRQAEGHWC